MLSIIELNEKKYYNSVDVIRENKLNIVNKRSIIKEMKLKDDEYIFAYCNTHNKWVISHQSYTNAKVLILTHVVDEYLKKSNVVVDDEFKNIVIKYELSKRYFLASSIMSQFAISIPDMFDNKEYVNGIHYIYIDTDGLKTLYFTFTGVTKLLYSLQHTLADKFHEWIVNMNCSQSPKYSTIQDAKCMASTFINICPCLYVLVIGDVKSLRGSMMIDTKYTDDQLVCKYGLTNNYVKRFDQHKNEFGNLHIQFICFVDDMFLYEAESHLKSYVRTLKIDFYHNNHVELMIIDKKMLNDQFKKELKLLGDLYKYRVSDSEKIIEKLQHDLEILKLKHKCEVSELSEFIAEKELHMFKKYYLLE